MNTDLVITLIGNAWYGVPLDRIQEVLRTCAITPVPDLPLHIVGLTNLRGMLIAVVDPRRLLEIPDSPSQPAALIVRDEPSEHASRAPRLPVAIIVDSVGDILSQKDVRQHPLPANVPLHHRRYLSGVVETDAGVVAILDLDGVIDPHAGKDQNNDETCS